MRYQKIPHRLLLYSVHTCQRILEDADLGRCKGEYNEQRGNQAEQGNGTLRFFASGSTIVELSRFVDIGNRGR